MNCQLIIKFVEINKQFMYTCQIIFTFAFCLIANAQLIGIDFGTEFTKVAMIHSGAGKSFSIVQSSKSERKIETAISFFNNQRFYESEAVGKRVRSTKNTFLYTKLFIENLNNRTELLTIQKEFFLNHHLINQQTQDMFYFLLDNFFVGENSEKVVITLEQAFGMIFRYIKKLSEKHGNSKIKDCVITIPNYWSLDQRIIMLNALAIADLYPLSIINQNTAAALQYGMNRNDNTTHRAAFYNLGSNSLQFTVAEFRLTNDSRTKKPVESVFIIAEFGIPRVGGLQFDLLLAKHFEKFFEQKYKKKLNDKARIKLLQESNQIKQVLSANKDAQVVVEELFQGIDFQTKITRTEFQKISENLLEKLTEPIVPFLRKNQLRTNQIHNVELIGGSIRIPKLQSLLNTTFKGSQVGTHMNGDQSMALGSVFYAANSSTKFKVKGMHLYDGFNFEVRLVLRNLQDGIEEQDPHYYFKNITLFKKKNRFGLIKEVNFKCRENLIAEFWKEDQNGLQLIKVVKLVNVTSYKETPKFEKLVPKVSLSIETDPIEIIVVSEAKVVIVADETVSYVEQVRKEKKKSKKKKAKKNDSTQPEQKSTTQDQKIKTQQNTDNVKIETNETIIDANETVKNSNKTKQKKDSNKTEEEDEYEYETVQRQKNVQKTYNLKINKVEKWYLRERLTGTKLQEAQKLLTKFDQQQEHKKKLAEAKNKLEAVVYQAKELLQNKQFKTFSTQEQRKFINTEIEAKQQLMYDSNNIQGFTKLYKQLNEPIQKIKQRMTEDRERDDIKKKVYESLQDYVLKIKKFEKQNSWLTSEQIQPLIELIQKTRKEFDHIYTEQAKRKKNEDVFTSNKKILKKIDPIKDLYFSLKSIPKPKVKKEDDKKTEQKKKETKEEELQL